MKQLILALLFSVTTTFAYTQTLTPGTDFPKAVFYKQDGKTFSTDQVSKDKKTLLMFFDATCGHCQKAATIISKRNKELSHINILLVTQDEQRSIDYFMTNFGKLLPALKNVTILQDKDHVFIPLFHPKQYPSLYLFGKDKKLIFYSSDEKDVTKFFDLSK